MIQGILVFRNVLQPRTDCLVFNGGFVLKYSFTNTSAQAILISNSRGAVLIYFN
jgi:hypothetical protein